MLNPKIGTLPDDWQDVSMNESWLPEGKWTDQMDGYMQKYRYRGIPIRLELTDETKYDTSSLTLYYYDVYINVWVELAEIGKVIDINNLKNLLNMSIDCLLGPKTVMRWSRRAEALVPK